MLEIVPIKQSEAKAFIKQIHRQHETNQNNNNEWNLNRVYSTL